MTKKTNYLAFYTDENSHNKIIYVCEVFGVSKSRLLNVMIASEQNIHKLYEYAKEYRETYDVEDGLDVGWLVKRRIIL